MTQTPLGAYEGVGGSRRTSPPPPAEKTAKEAASKKTLSAGSLRTPEPTGALIRRPLTSLVIFIKTISHIYRNISTEIVTPFLLPFHKKI